jgi:hypothetical protein
MMNKQKRQKAILDSLKMEVANNDLNFNDYLSRCDKFQFKLYPDEDALYGEENMEYVTLDMSCERTRGTKGRVNLYCTVWWWNGSKEMTIKVTTKVSELEKGISELDSKIVKAIRIIRKF